MCNYLFIFVIYCERVYHLIIEVCGVQLLSPCLFVVQ